MARGVDIEIPAKLAPLYRPARYKVFYGGRGGAKSWGFARALLVLALTRRMRILCAREFQVSIADSVHRLLCDQISELKLSASFTITRTQISALNGSEFIFKGIRHNAQEIKSLEGVDVCWVEEAQSVSRESWDLLIPTIRKQGSEIWISFNPGLPDDETYQRFVLNPPEGAVVVKVGWEDNPWLPDTLRAEKDYCLSADPEAYAHIWGGEPRVVSDAQVFKGRYEVTPFETPPDARFFHGADWGFAQDPTALVRMFIKDECLYIDAEAWGTGVELDELPALFDSIPTARTWPIKADGARPETISHMARKGFRISAAKKWAGSVEDGVALLKGFRRIHIHPRCRHCADEFRLYSYKVDKNNGDVLPILVDAHNHCIDAARYALDGYVKSAPLNISPAAVMPRTTPRMAGMAGMRGRA
ncbi:MAG: PBSX family phage terminase large subunit [Desulfovibrionaceae bacterium]|nr:PBSX family phage terminase large subunit [Desulfovibrionaceae bacterium]